MADRLQPLVTGLFLCVLAARVAGDMEASYLVVFLPLFVVDSVCLLGSLCAANRSARGARAALCGLKILAEALIALRLQHTIHGPFAAIIVPTLVFLALLAAAHISYLAKNT